MSDAEAEMRKRLARSGKIKSEGDDKGLLKWLRGLVYREETVRAQGGSGPRVRKTMEDCRTPHERRIQQRLEGRPVEPVTRLQQRMG